MYFTLKRHKGQKVLLDGQTIFFHIDKQMISYNFMFETLIMLCPRYWVKVKLY